MNNELLKNWQIFVSESHKGQKRWDGGNYYDNHLVPVSLKAVSLINELANFYDYLDLINPNSIESRFSLYDLTHIVSLGHDLYEDTKIRKDALYKNMSCFLDKNIIWEIDFCLKMLSKQIEGTKEKQTYYEFVKQICHIDTDRCFFACSATKLADIHHNCYASETKEGSLKDKYRFAADAIYGSLKNKISEDQKTPMLDLTFQQIIFS